MKLFVWDFHGVLERGNEAAVCEISNAVLEEHGYKERFLVEDCIRLYGKKWYEYFRDILPGESHERHMDLQEACFAYQTPELIARHIQANDHADYVLSEIGRVHEQVVLSNTPPDSLEMFLDSVGLKSHFTPDRAIAVDSHRKVREKIEALREYVEGQSFDSVVVISDSPEDLVLAESFGGKFYLYAHPGVAYRGEAGKRIHDLRELLREI